MHKLDAMASEIERKNDVGFWCKVKKLGFSKQVISMNIDGVIGKESLSNHWANLFDQEFSLPKVKEIDGNLLHQRFKTGDSLLNFCITYEMTKESLEGLGNNKSIELDGIQAEDLKLAPVSAIITVVGILNLCFAHSFLSASILSVRILPIIKKKGVC